MVGFGIRWVVLCGPDNVEVNRVPTTPVWGCKNIDVSNMGWPADFTFRAANLLDDVERLRGFGEGQAGPRSSLKRR